MDAKEQSTRALASGDASKGMRLARRDQRAPKHGSDGLRRSRRCCFAETDLAPGIAQDDISHDQSIMRLPTTPHARNPPRRQGLARAEERSSEKPRAGDCRNGRQGCDAENTASGETRRAQLKGEVTVEVARRAKWLRAKTATCWLPPLSSVHFECARRLSRGVGWVFAIACVAQRRH